MENGYREALCAYAKEKYGAAPEHLWRRFPAFAVLRHGDNGKWFGVLMEVPAEKLGLPGDGLRDILNVRLSDLMLRDYLLQQPGFLPAYHMTKGYWISILLDGSVRLEELCRWLDESYVTTASRAEKQRLRPPKEWLIPANPAYFDVQAAFEAAEEINWKQGKGLKTGDTVFMYVAAPVSAILYKCLITQTDLPVPAGKRRVHITSLMRIRLLKHYDPECFTFERLKRDYGIHAVRGPRGIPESLSRAL